MVLSTISVVVDDTTLSGGFQHAILGMLEQERLPKKDIGSSPKLSPISGIQIYMKNLVLNCFHMSLMSILIVVNVNEANFF